MKVKIIGAGSIGNHLSHAARALGWSVDLCDNDTAALSRTMNDIYPSRYGSWDKAINLFHSSDVPRSGHDIIFIGTPPDSHVRLATDALDEHPLAVVIEKPLSTPDLKGLSALYKKSQSLQIPIFVGYDHAVGESTAKLISLAKSSNLGGLASIDVQFREHWGGIFNAHPWLSGPSDSYLGYSSRGGGACCEHSHAINLWQFFSEELGAGLITEVQAMMDFYKHDAIFYDRICSLNLRTESGLIGRCIQDVVTSPPDKSAHIQFEVGSIRSSYSSPGHTDSVSLNTPSGNSEFLFPKSRPDDFITELMHIDLSLSSKSFSASPLSLERALRTMLVIAAAHLSHNTQRSIKIDYSCGYHTEALEVI